jgi:DNA-binding NarL/FixJ family response regulator
VASNDNAILIADDSEVFRRSVRSYLVRNNFKVCGEAIDGTELLKKAKELEPSLIILDFRMPYMNGIELASVLRRRMPDVRSFFQNLVCAGDPSAPERPEAVLTFATKIRLITISVAAISYVAAVELSCALDDCSWAMAECFLSDSWSPLP